MRAAGCCSYTRPFLYILAHPCNRRHVQRACTFGRCSLGDDIEGEMSKQSVIRFAVLYGVALGLGVTVASSCVGVNYPTVAFRCNPRQTDNCPDSHYCCSDDPAAEEDGLPNYLDKGVTNGTTPYFSGPNNAVGTSGMCVNRDDIPPGSGLLEAAAANCPIPCNPTWTDKEIAVICGVKRVCCQTTALESADCVNDNGTFRPVTGRDIGSLTNWDGNAHATHQDAAGIGCTGLAIGAGAMPDSVTDHPVFRDCIAQLSVADQRGFCMALGSGQACPTEQPEFIDACALRNSGAAPM